jgi:hypothetical protein
MASSKDSPAQRGPRADGLYVSVGPIEDREILRFFPDGTVVSGASEDPLHKVQQWLVPTPLAITKRRGLPPLLPAPVTRGANTVAFQITVNDRGDETIRYSGRWSAETLDLEVVSFNGYRATVSYTFVADDALATKKPATKKPATKKPAAKKPATKAVTSKKPVRK